MKRLLWLLALAGCPAEMPFVVTDVHVAGRPVADALVGVYCAGSPRRDTLGVTGGTAQRTDETGRARLRMPYGALAGDCTVTVAKPGLPTIESRGANACSSPVECPALDIDLAELGVGVDLDRDGLRAAPADFDRDGAPPREVAPPALPTREFARPPTRSASPPAEVAK
jgi:hypothetical protein